MQNYKPKIFVSCIYKLEKDSPQKRIKTEIIKRLREADFEPQVFLEEGLAEFMPWSFETVYDLMKKCDGAVILGLSRKSMQTANGLNGIPTEYNHYEGALAASLKLPLLILPEDGLQERGIFYNNGGFIYTSISTNADNNWFNNDEYFVRRFNIWKKAVANRYQVFLGYCGAAKDTANAVSIYITNRMNLKVKEYRTSFVPGKTILEEI